MVDPPSDLICLYSDASDSSSIYRKFGFQVPSLLCGRSQAGPEMPSLELCFRSSDLHSFVFGCALNHICSVQFNLPLSSQSMEKQRNLFFKFSNSDHMRVEITALGGNSEPVFFVL